MALDLPTLTKLHRPKVVWLMRMATTTTFAAARDADRRQGDEGRPSLPLSHRIKFYADKIGSISPNR